MSGEDKHDALLLSILKEEGQIIPFLNAIFGFLYRRTDFYITKDNPSVKIGFLPGISERTVRDTFRKWQILASSIMDTHNICSMESDMSDLVIQEEEVVTTDNVSDFPETLTPQPQHVLSKVDREDDLSSDTYNGADCGNYHWSQTAVDVDIKVPVPVGTKTADVQVDIQTNQLSVTVRNSEGQWTTLVNGSLTHRHLKEESIWTLLSGKHITIHLQKANEKWWDSLFTTEKKLDMSKVDVSRHVTDLPEEDHMQVEKVMVQEERKRLGILMPDHQEKLDILKKAWHLEGSPFQGTPFDPSVLQLPQ